MSPKCLKERDLASNDDTTRKESGVCLEIKLKNMFLGPVLLGLMLLSGCSKPVEVKEAVVQKRDVESIVTSVNAGTIKPERSAELAFGAVGRVQSINVELGQAVKEGEILSEIENSDLVTGLSRMEKEYKRRLNLNGIPQSEIDLSKQGVDASLMQLEKTRIRAPYDGIIAELNLEIGQLSQITTIIPKAPIRIVDLLPRYVRAQIDEADLPKVKLGMDARIKVLASKKETFIGKVRKIIPYVSNVREQDRTCEIEVTTETDQVLPAGASADVEIILDKRSNVLSLPTRAIFGRAQDKFVYVKEGSYAKKRAIKTGLSNFDYVEILSGVSDGETVLIPTDRSVLLDGVKVIVAVK
jgi:HlyD family secretion protein